MKLSERTALKLRLLSALNGSRPSQMAKTDVRALHLDQRRERSLAESRLISSLGPQLLNYFAEGWEVDPAAISPKLVLVERPDSINGYLFRLATLLWSIPVSHGYGRRLRYLVMDQSNAKLIGLLALGDPVFNLACRDSWIGWNVRQREERLSYVLDAYVLGAVPPYSAILGGKLVASLVASSEIRTAFRMRYSTKPGIIAERMKDPHLVLVTTTSALGRSSLYNRLRLPGMLRFESTGFTGGWGHFRVPNELFQDLRAFLKEEGNRYYDNYEYGQGPNWKLRAIREAASILGIEEDILRHGVQREAFAVPLTSNWREILLGASNMPEGEPHSAQAIAAAALTRWVLPRAERTSDWKAWLRSDTWRQMTACL